ncbi:MAG TPA: hypothetical protein GXZ47_06510 [Treponema sp.]|nr:hypothetical protein [Treponema sp.]
MSLILCGRTPLWAFDISDSISQELGLNIHQEVNLHGIREDNPTNTDNWQKLSEWETQMSASLDWYLGFSNRCTITAEGTMNWLQHAEPCSEENRRLQGNPAFALNEALLAVNIHEVGIRFFAGKTLVTQGPAVIFPVLDFLAKDCLAKDLKTASAEQEGLWMTGASFGKNNIFAEIWFSPALSWAPGEDFSANSESNPVVLFHTVYTLGTHRFGLIYYYGGQTITGNTAGAYYSGQISDSLIPYGEVSFADHRLVPGLPAEATFQLPETKSVDATVGLSYAPDFANLSFFFEYRFRSSGYNSKTWNSIKSELSDLSALVDQAPQNEPLYKRLCGAHSSSLPYFNTSVHSAGIRIQNSRQIADLFDYNINTFYLAPDGIYLSAHTSLSLIDRLKIGLTTTGLFSLADKGEMAWWENNWQLQLAAEWQLRTYE